MHSIVRGEDPDYFLCADDQNPRTAGRQLTPIRVVHDGELRIEHRGEVRMAILCDGCLEGLLRHYLPPEGLQVG